MFKRKEDNTEDTMFARMIVVHSLIIQGLRDDHKHHKKGLQSLQGLRSSLERSTKK